MAGVADGNARRLESLHARLEARSPGLRVNAWRERVQGLESRLAHAVERRLADAAGRLQVARRTLGAVSPLATLERGYAIATLAGGGLLTDAAQVAAGDAVDLRLAHGRVHTEVKGSDDD